MPFPATTTHSDMTGIAKRDMTTRLMQRPDYPPAAPEWCRDALKTINALEYELERK